MKFEKILSIFVIIMYIFEPVSAFEIFGHEVNTNIDVDWTDPASIVGGAAVGAAVAFAFGTGVGEAAIGAAVVGALVAEGANKLFLHNSNDAQYTGGEQVTNLSQASENRKNKLLAGYIVYSQQAAANDTVRIRQKLASHLTSYETQNSGSITDVDVSLKGADKIHGFSVFPIQIDLKESVPSSLPQQSHVDINSIKVYLVDEDGRKWSEKTFNRKLTFRDPNAYLDEPNGNEQYDEGEYLTRYLLNMTLKTPDPYVGKARLASQGSANAEDLEELVNANVKKFQIVVEFSGQAVLYKWEHHVERDDSGAVIKEWWDAEYDKTVPVNLKMTSLSAWNHIANGKYVIDGVSGSLPTSYSNEENLVPYKTYANGAVSNIIGRCWASPCHVFESSAQYKFVFLGEPDNLEPVPVLISDDYAALPLRIRSDGSGLLGGQPSKGSIGEIGYAFDDGTILSLYYTKSNDTVGYRAYMVIYATAKDEVGSEPIWLILKPDIAVLDNTKLAGSDDRLKEIDDLLKDGKVSTEDIQQIQQKCDIMINDLQNKKASLEASLDKYKSNDKAYDNAKTALDCYEKALDNLKDAKASANPNEIRTKLYLAQNYEMEGDYYRQAAEYRLVGLDEQAGTLEKQGNVLQEDSKQYEPSVWFAGGSQIHDIVMQIASGLGLEEWHVYALIVVIIVILSIILAIKVLDAVPKIP